MDGGLTSLVGPSEIRGRLFFVQLQPEALLGEIRNPDKDRRDRTISSAKIADVQVIMTSEYLRGFYVMCQKSW